MLVYVAVSCPRSTFVPGQDVRRTFGLPPLLANRCRRATTRRLFHSGARKVWNNCSLVILFELREATLNGCACRPNDGTLPRWIFGGAFFCRCRAIGKGEGPAIRPTRFFATCCNLPTGFTESAPSAIISRFRSDPAKLAQEPRGSGQGCGYHAEQGGC